MRALYTAEVTHQLGSCFGDIGHFTECLGIGQSMIRFVRSTQSGEFIGMGIPIEIAAINNTAAYTRGMSVHVFGGGMYHDVCSPFKRTAVDRSRESIVYDQRYTVIVSYAGKLFNVEHFKRGIRDGFAEQGFRVRAESSRNLFFAGIRTDKGNIDTELFQRYTEEVECAAIDG